MERALKQACLWFLTPQAPCAFKISMIHVNLQVISNNAACCALHRDLSQVIRC